MAIKLIRIAIFRVTLLPFIHTEPQSSVISKAHYNYRKASARTRMKNRLYALAYNLKIGEINMKSDT